MVEFTEVLVNISDSFIKFLPNLLGALVLLGIGWLIGSVVGRIVKEIVRRLKLDDLLFKKKKPLFKLSDLFSIIFSWAIYILFIQAAFETLGIPALVEALSAILAFIPGLIKAIIIVVAGYAIAEYVREKIEESKIMYCKLVAKIMFFIIIYIAVATALPSIGIDASLINMILIILVASFGLGMAIAIGLGLKDTVARLAKKKFK
jgi:hypothetical protein